jgi:molybdenum cofactor cytidylyltransferase
MKTGIIILAAGESARMGEPKQLLKYRGRTLLRHTVDVAHALSCSPVAVVLGAHAGQIRPQLDATRVLITENPDWPDGMGSSIRAGLRALLDAHPKISAAIFLVCDQPLLTPATLRSLIATHERTGGSIVASEYDGVLGVPAFFTRSFFPELLALDGAAGARQVISTNRAHAIGVPFSEGTVDIDTPADFARLRNSPVELRTPVLV